MFRTSHTARFAARTGQQWWRRRTAPNRTGFIRSLASVVPPQAKEPTELDKVTTLPNGIRVASEDLPDAFSGVGVYIDAGSRYENDYLCGSSHIMDRLAFKSTTKRTAEETMETVDELGGNIQCASSRESIMYQAATFNSSVAKTVDLLADTIRNPLLTAEEINQQLATAAYEVREIWDKPELILPELLHMAAYKDNTLGNPLLCPKERLDVINKDVIDAYRKTFYRPDRMVVAFAGVSHAEAVRLTEASFGDMKAPEPRLSPSASDTSLDSLGSQSSTSSSVSSTSSAQSIPLKQPSKLLSRIPFLKKLSTSASKQASVLPGIPNEHLLMPAHYTGGMFSLPPRPVSSNPNQPNFSHIYLAFEGLPISSDDIYALATLQTLLGGGGSFSAGGPGKGMYSRLYTRVLNQHGWVESCVSFNHSYADSGLFGIAASCYPGRTAAMLDVMCGELAALCEETPLRSAPNSRLVQRAQGLHHSEVARAKNQLRSSLLMNLESRMVELEDLGRQVQVHGRKVPVREMTARIAALTPADLRRVARLVLGGLVENPGRGTGAPTVVLQEAAESDGSVSPMPWDKIQDVIYQWKLGRR